MKITVEDAFRLHAALSSLDGYDLVADGKPIRAYYTLGKLRQTVALNLNLLDPVIRAHSKARNDLVLEMSDGAGAVPAAKALEFQKKIGDMLGAETEVALLRITLDDLNLEVNPIPGTVSAAIAMLQEASGGAMKAAPKPAKAKP